MHLHHGSALECTSILGVLQCTWIMGVHFSALGSWECTSVHVDHGIALQCTWIMGVHFSSALGSLECTSVHLDHGSALQCSALSCILVHFHHPSALSFILRLEIFMYNSFSSNCVCDMAGLVSVILCSLRRAGSKKLNHPELL